MKDGRGQRLGEDPTNPAHIHRHRLERPCGRPALADPARRAASSSFGAQSHAAPLDASEGSSSEIAAVRAFLPR